MQFQESLLIPVNLLVFFIGREKYKSMEGIGSHPLITLQMWQWYSWREQLIRGEPGNWIIIQFSKEGGKDAVSLPPGKHYQKAEVNC